MPFRDDDEAARARADALQVDLDRANEKLEKTEDKLEQAEDETDVAKRELAETRARLARAEAKLAERGEKVPPPSPPPRSTPAPAPSRPMSVGAALLLIGAFIAVAILLIALRARNTSSSPSGIDDVPNPSCTLTTEPPGAAIIAICRDEMSERMNAGLLDAGTFIQLPTTYESRLGTTPITRSRLDWIAAGVTCHGRLIARLDGYRDTPVSTPLEGMGCRDVVVPLEK